MVEFALLAPVAVLLLMGLLVVGMLTTNIVQLNNAVRDGARAAAVCGSSDRDASTIIPTSDTAHQKCNDANIRWYITSHLSAVPANLSPAIEVCDSSTQSNCTASSASGDVINTCQAYSKYVLVTASIRQSMYLPLVGQFFGVDATDRANDTRLITATAEATCEQ